MQVRDLGQMEYGACLRLMHQLRDERIAGKGEDTVLVVEHPPVATLGRRGVAQDVFDPALPVFTIDRGGKATLHAPGQMVIYPIVHLGEGNRDVRAWVRHLEGFVIDLLAARGIQAETRPETPGVWTTGSGKKIASIGIAIQHWVSTHGIALNVNIPPTEFERLDPCGLGAAVMTNMHLEGAQVSMDEIKQETMARAAQHFRQFQAKR